MSGSFKDISNSFFDYSPTPNIPQSLQEETLVTTGGLSHMTDKDLIIWTSNYIGQYHKVQFPKSS